MRQQAEAVWLGTPSALLRCIGGVGHSRMRTAEKYRRFGHECVELARTAKSPANKTVLLHMAQVWFRLAEEHAASDRKALAKAIAALGDGDVLLVTSLDRLARWLTP
jgi:uncharacterized protein YbgA (DUF1722 family)